MANTKLTGIVFSNSHDDALGGLTARRSMGSVPFPGCPTPVWIRWRW